jgi:negative regulator of flagellin synthesis FlgM
MTDDIWTGRNVMVDGVRINGTGPIDRVARGVAAVGRARIAPAPVAEPSTVATLAAQDAPVDTSRVAAIRAAIANGSYNVDPDAIAAKMIEIDLPR